jgi:heme exporter protein B
MRRWWQTTRALVWKDIQVELRTREVGLTAVLFSLVLVTVFLFSGLESSALAGGAAPGVLWVCIAFVGALVFGRTFQREREERTLQGLLLSGVPMDALFAAKVLFNLGIMAAVLAVLVPAVLVTFRVQVSSVPLLLATLSLGTLGFTVMGTVLSAALSSVRLREVMLPMVLYPLCTPLLIAGVRATSALTQDGGGIRDWLAMMATFNLLFLALGRWLFAESVDGGE